VRVIAADLHIHTALSPCADDAMTPPAIVAKAVSEGLEMIAICDHNSAGNVAAVQEAAPSSLGVIAGIEITTAEEAHVIGFFRDASSACAAADEVQATLPASGKSTKRFGNQLLLDAEGRVCGTQDSMLSSACGLDLRSAVSAIKMHEGLAVAAHVDRPSFSVTSQLGMVPEDAGFDAIEISAAGARASRADDFVALGLPIITSSDSHFVDNIGDSRTRFEIHTLTFDELLLAFRGAAGRRVHRA